MTLSQLVIVIGQTYMPIKLLLEINFGTRGNSCPYQLSGWSLPDTDKTWTDGRVSRLTIPESEVSNANFIEFSAIPCVFSDGLAQQHFAIEVNDCHVGVGSMSQTASLAWELPLGFNRERGRPTTITLKLPNAAIPAQFAPSSDDRELALWISRLRLYQQNNNGGWRVRRSSTEIGLPLSASVDELKQAAERITSVPILELLTSFESAGDNCEFGLLQRKFGIEVLGMLRFAASPLNHLLVGLDREFLRIDDPTTLLPIQEPDQRWYVRSQVYHIGYRTHVPCDEANSDEMQIRESKRLRFLRRKFIEDVTNGEKTFILRRNQPLELHDVLPVYIALRKYGDAKLLFIVQATGHYSPGTVEELLPGLFRGHIDRISEMPDASRFSIHGWLSVLINAYLLRADVSSTSNRGAIPPKDI